MKVTQGVLKWSSLYGIVFYDKYLDIKTILTTDNYSSKFKNNVSQTSTILSNNNIYYNTVENCNLINCDVNNGRFINSKLIGMSGLTLGLTGITNYINDGYFSGCTISGYIINGGKFYNCIINSNNIWNDGHWTNDNGSSNFSTTWKGGIWNSGVFSDPKGWSGGTFNGGTFIPPAVWYDGIANGGTFSGITWYNGLVRNANFVAGCSFEDGIFNNGSFIDSNFDGGVFNNGTMYNSIINNATFYDGNISGSTINNAVINGGNFTNLTINFCDTFNMNASNITVNDGNFYNGNYNNIIFNGGNIYNGLYTNISGSTSNLTIHNGLFTNSFFNSINIHNGNFTNCYSNNVIWQYGVYTEGQMYDSYWYDGYWNDGIFSAILGNTTSTSNTLSISVVTTTISGLPCGTPVSYASGQAYPSSGLSYLGTSYGTVNLTFDALNIPDQFIVIYDNNIVINTGYRGSSSYDFGGGSRNSFKTALSGKTDPVNGGVYPNFTNYVDDGYPRVITAPSGSAGSGVQSFYKSLTQTAIVKVYAPMPSTQWNYTLGCPY